MDLRAATRRLERRRPLLDALAHRAATLRRSGGRPLTFGPTPAVPPVVRRDLAASLDFLRGPELAGDGTGPSLAFRAERERLAGLRSSDDLATRVRGCPWYHTIELPGGVVTPGIYDHRPLLGRYGLPERLDGRRVLDVATFDGFWAFELERRGGRVTGLDLPASLRLDLPPAAMARAEAEELSVPIGLGFAVASEALGSAVERREGSVYELDPATWGTYDLVHLGDLLLHLERPWEALRAIRTVTEPGGVLHLADSYDPLLTGPTARYLGGWRDVEWWVPSLTTLTQWVADAGFADLEVLGSYQLNIGSGSGAYWRAIIRARAR